VQIGTEAKVRGIGDRKVVEPRKVSARSQFGPLGGSRDSAISAASDIRVAHDSSVMSR